MKLKTVSGMMLNLLLIGMLTLASNIQTVKSEPKTWTVDDDGPADFSSIQEAINSPDVTGGDTIFVKEGTYYENIIVNKNNLALVGENRETSIIEGNGTGTVVYVFADSVNISRFTIRNSGPSFNDAGIFLRNSQGCSIERNEIPAESMGIVISGGSENRLISNRILHGIICCQWYGIHLINSSGNVVAGNFQESGEVGIVLREGSCGNNISNNQIGYNMGLGIFLSHGSNSNIIRENKVGLCFGGQVMGLIESSGNVIYHNHFIGYTHDDPPLIPPVAVSESFENVWDDGYPSGGNYWTDYDASDPWAYYNGSDFYSGPYQNETGSDGIVDTPYVLNQDNIDHYPLMKPYGGPHDIGITSITTSKTIVCEGYDPDITLKILNYGIETETFTVTAYASATEINREEVTLTSRSSTNITFTWNTTGFAKGVYTITANVTILPGEIDTADNSKTDGTISVNMMGDLNSDGKVTIADIVIIALAFGSKPGDSNWNPNADLNDDGRITITDIVIAALHFGETDP